MSLNTEAIESLYHDVLGFVTCPHGKYLPTTPCNQCNSHIVQEIRMAAALYLSGKP